MKLIPVIGMCASLLTACADSTPLSVPVWSLDRELRIDGTVENLVAMSWICVFSDGMMAVSQFDDRSVLFFDSAGKRIGSFGRAGDGPEDFEWPNVAGMAGDTLWVRDSQKNRITMIDRNRKFAGTIQTVAAAPRPEDASIYPPLAFVTPVAVIPNGGIIASGQRSQRTPAPPGFDTTTVPYFLLDRGMVLERVLIRVARNERASIPIREASGGSAAVTVPFQQPVRVAWSLDGRHMASARISDSPAKDRIELVMLTSLGDTIYVRQYPFAVVPIPKETADSAVDATLERMKSNPVVALQMSGLREKLRLPAYYPPLTFLRVGRDGSAWLGLRAVAGRRSWQIVDPAGEMAGSIVLPSSAFIQEASMTRIWVTEFDSTDVPSVVRYRIGS
jgi:hypothetical protein